MQVVPQLFHDMANNSVIPLDWEFSASFDKSFDDDVAFFTLDVSELDGVDILGSSDNNPIQEWDKYNYTKYRDRVISMEWQRTLDFPYSVQSAIADVTLNNYDDYFTPNSGSPIDDYILPKRPMRIYAGFQNTENLSQLVGLSQGSPELSESEKTASFHILDFLSEMFNMDLSSTIAMRDVRTDEVLDAIFQQFGLLPSQYNLAKGRNIIPFLFIEKGTNAGEVFRQLMQAEMGKLWLDEQGILRFEQRLMTGETSVITFDETNIIDFQDTQDDEIINDIRITSNVRKVFDFQPIFTNAQSTSNYTFSVESSFKIPASSTAFYPYASLDDPAISATVPTNGRQTDTSWFTARKSNGTIVNSGVSITFTQLNTSSYTMLFENTNGFDVYIDQIEVWGEPARIVNELRYRAYDDVSVGKYGNQVLEINNDFFGNEANCNAFADYVLESYKDYAGIVEITVKGDPSMQLGDIATVNYKNTNGTYKIIDTKLKMENFALQTTIRARKYTIYDWFVLDQSELDGTDILAP